MYKFRYKRGVNSAMEIIRPLYSSKDLKEKFLKEKEKKKQIEMDKYHTGYIVLQWIAILFFLVLMIIVGRALLIHSNSILPEEPKYPRVFNPNKHSTFFEEAIPLFRAIMTFIVGMVIISLTAYRTLAFILSGVKKYWISRGYWKEYDEKFLEVLRGYINTYEQIEELLKFPQCVIIKVHLHIKEKTFTVTLKEDRCTIEKTITLGCEFYDIYRPGVLDFTVVDLEVDKLFLSSL